jgi:hypothetical protein
MLSVGVVAWASGNPFNAAVFAAFFLVLLAVAASLEERVIHVAGPERSIPGALLIGFGWFYPHFLETDRWITYAYAAPLGLLPCPTLSTVIGVTLMLDSLGSRSWAFALAVVGFTFGTIGVVHLGVTLDAVLVAGAFAMLVAAGREAQPEVVGHRPRG